MKQVKIRSLKYPDPAVNWDFQSEDPQAKLDALFASGACGKPERWVLHKDELGAEAYDDADVLEEKTEEVTHSVVAGEGESSELITSQKWVKLKAEYTVEIEDITAQVAQEVINAEALAYLASTDWMIIREVDSGLACPAEVKAERAAARTRIVK